MRNVLKGFLGELKIKLFAFFILGPSYDVVNNVTLEMPDKNTVQIDHVILSTYGIFVIETKNYSGRITINNGNTHWWQGFGTNGNRFYSPVCQNDGHIRALRYILKSKQIPMINIVAFVGSSTFSQSHLPSGVYGSAFDAIIGIKKHKRILLSAEQVYDAYTTLQSYRLPRTLKTRRRHIKSVKSKLSNR